MEGICNAIDIVCIVLIAGKLTQDFAIYSQILRLLGESYAVKDAPGAK
jgi:hypothetical protein